MYNNKALQMTSTKRFPKGRCWKLEVQEQLFKINYNVQEINKCNVQVNKFKFA